MEFNEIGKSVNRFDAAAKVTGKAKYASDFHLRDMLVAGVLRSTIAHGRVVKIDTSTARALKGVEAVITFEDVPDHKFPTAGHPWSTESSHQDIADRNLLTGHIRYYGDEIAAVIASDEITMRRALRLIEVEYEEYPVILTVEDALAEGAPEIHEGTGNLVGRMNYEFGDVESAFAGADLIVEGEYETRTVQHCAMENHNSYAYLDENNRLTIVSSTQIPHIVRRIVGQALEKPVHEIRVIKPYIGGGFGSKQDACVEPLNAYLSLAVGGRPVRLEMTREESIIGTRVRHAVKYKMKTGVMKDGRIVARQAILKVAKGAYASHGISPTAKQGTAFLQLYKTENVKFDLTSVYSNAPAAGAMRAYGIPQINFAMETHMDDVALKLGLEPLEFRKLNQVDVGYRDPKAKLEILTCGLSECQARGMELIGWDEKRKKYANQTGDIRRGVGMAQFSYGTGTYPVCLEIAGARLILRPDGSIHMQVGATEIGQGSDTVLSQMAAEVLGIPTSMVLLQSTTDSDTSPFDTGAYASRQTYVSGAAVKKAAMECRGKILKAVEIRWDIPVEQLDIRDAVIVESATGKAIVTLPDLALDTYYNRELSAPISAETSFQTKSNALSFGVTFTEVEVDMKTGLVTVIELYNVHDSGIIINRQLAEGQVLGGISMGLGYALTEELKLHPETGKPLNNNLLDYKLPTMMDTPLLGVDFVETFEPTGPFGNKSLGEPPTISPAPAIRNAVLHATGIGFNSIPMDPQRVFEGVKKNV
ncbi:MAG: xanthine dehydrogenase molybdenum-binding subunit XdhA [Spirochaetales bacterium]|nr:xanthine dehydrogenase molybdenum-binding subunit XdhA [Spirochaetales bacterium]